MKHYAPGTSGSPPELTEMERIALEVSRQVRWAKNQLTLYENESPKKVNDSSLAYLRGYGDALKGILTRIEGSLSGECAHDWASWGTGHAHKVGERVEQCCSCGQQRTITMSTQEREQCPCMECETYNLFKSPR